MFFNLTFYAFLASIKWNVDGEHTGACHSDGTAGTAENGITASQLACRETAWEESCRGDWRKEANVLFNDALNTFWGAGRSSEVERSLMMRWVVGSILHGVVPLSYFSFQPVLHDWCNKGRGMCYPVCGMVHIKEPLLLIDKSSLCGGSGFPFSLSEWSLTICLTPYNRR